MKEIDGKTQRMAGTILGILFTFLIFIGGFLLTEELFRLKERSLISEKTQILLVESQAPVMEEGRKLSLAEMAVILSQWYPVAGMNGESVLATEPAKNQIELEQAYTAVMDLTGYFTERGLVPEGFFDDATMSSYLKIHANPVVTESDDKKIEEYFDMGILQSLPSEYRYWEICFVNSEMEFGAKVNALTGEVWSIELVSKTLAIHYDDIREAKLLEDFIDYLELKEEGQMEYVGIIQGEGLLEEEFYMETYRDIGDKQFRARVTRQQYRFQSDTLEISPSDIYDNRWNVLRISLTPCH